MFYVYTMVSNFGQWDPKIVRNLDLSRFQTIVALCSRKMLSFSNRLIDSDLTQHDSFFQGQIKDAMGVSTYQFANLYSWYSWPNVILPIVGGYLMDTVFGIRLGTIIFAMFIILGKIKDTHTRARPGAKDSLN